MSHLGMSLGRRVGRRALPEYFAETEIAEVWSRTFKELRGPYGWVLEHGG